MISYIRNPKEFKLNKYVQYIETPVTVGLYARIDKDQPARVVSDADFVWADGADRPTGDWNQLRFEWVEFSVKRRDYPFRVGNIALAQAKNSWKPLEQHAGMAAMQAMINRTSRVISMLETSANWSGNTDAVTNLNSGAGKWDSASDDPSSPQYNAIKRALLKAAERVNLATNSVVQPDDLVLLISPGLAQAIANTAEVHNYLKYGPFSKAQLEDTSNNNQRWGLPPSLYGFEVVVEDSSKVTSRPAADGTAATTGRTYIKGDTSAVMMSRKGGVNGIYGAPNFSTVQLYWHKWEMSVFTFDDPKNERTDGHVTDMFAEVLAAPETGYLITGCL
jgi:hypothetical protein